MNDRKAALLLVAIATLFFGDVLFFGNNFWFADLFLYHFPMKHVVRETILRGEFPWWNPYFAGGQPMAANPAYEVFYPPQWLIFIGPYRFGFALHIIAHVYIALLGAYAFLRAIPLRIDAAIFGALSFAFSGFLLGSLSTLPMFFVWSWAGVVGWGVLRAIRGQGIAAAAIALAMPLLVFEPVSLAQMFALVIAGTLFVDRRAIGRVGAAIIIAMIIAAVVVIPAIDHARDSIRSVGFSYDVASLHSMPPLRPIELLFPRFLGIFDGDIHAFWGYFEGSKRTAPYVLSLYCGAAVAILSIAGLLLRRRGALFVLGVCTASYLLAIGDNTPLFRGLYAAGMKSIRYPEKFIGAALVTLIFFAATIANDLDDRRLRRAVLMIGLAVAGALLATAAVVNADVFARMWDAQNRELAGFFRQGALSAGVIALLWAVALWRVRTGRVWVIAALALLIFDVVRFGDAFLPRKPKSFFTPPPIVAAFDRDRANYAIFNRGEWTQQPIARRNAEASLAWFDRNGLRPYSPASWGLRSALELDYDETDLLPTHELLDRMKELGKTEPFIAVSNVRFVLDLREPEVAMAEAKAGPQSWQPLIVHRVPSSGRYWFANAALARINRVAETFSSADLDVDAASFAQLMITITTHKYWQAWIDGQPVPLRRANIAYQSVNVPPGRHRVALRYRNPLIAWSGALSLIGLIALIPRRRRPRSAP